ncbi:BAI1-associated protein 3 isoform X1 [Camponotus floridanus]|uniref:BAI1-associated protein 3 isoform X1 n=1 Tax=Camponotus floridanus TaxID=104421 RepID=UPI000DC6BCA5|nr:BAI1-associated protein 3 isoform X1 [Camponotus floridanus]
MSFFNSLQEIVTNSVASLSLSPKRFSFSREDSKGDSSGTGRSSSTGSVTSTTNTSTTAAQQATPHGFPKVVPPPGTVTSHTRSLSTRRRTLECTSSPGLTVHPATGSGATSPRRVGSFRRSGGSSDRPPLMFCRRRPSWPEVDIQATSGVQETDGSFFESFTALSWKQENRRLVVLQEVEARAKEPPPPSRDSISTSHPYRLSKKEIEQLYIEVLYTIANTVGASTGQYAHYKEDLYRYAQEAFGVPSDQHRRYLNIASEEKPPIVVLSVVVIEADGLEAKDVNGFSDPYCMLGIQPGNAGAPLSPQTNLTAHSPHTPPASPRQATRALSDGGDNENSHHEKLRKHHSFRLSFKRKEHSRREHRESLSGALPAKFIRATSVKPHTLSPRWNEKFRFDIDDINTDILHLDIWDHDDESSVFDAVIKLNEVRGVKGLGRFFKQIAQSARSGSQDDFLGCVNIPLVDIPSTGVDQWYKLEARTQRSNIQGRIRLKLWLSTREDRGSEEDNWGELRQQERLYTVFLNHEMNKQGEEFTGELPQTALTILHQHAVQGDVTELQQALIRWVASSRQHAVDPRTLHRLLQELDNRWHTETLSRDAEQCLADSFNDFLEVSLKKVRQHRVLYPPLHRPTISKLDYLLRCLGLLSNMKAFRTCCPFNKEIRGEIITALRKGTLEWYEDTRQQTMCHDQEPDQDIDRVLQDFTNLVTTLLVDLEQGLLYYNSLFESTNGVPYFSAVYKQLEKLLAEHVAKHMENTSEMHNELGARVTTACLQLHSQNRDEEYVLPPGAEIGTPIFELYLALQDFVNMKENLPQSDHKTLAICKYYEWFRPAVDKWLDLAKLKAVQRVRRAAELDRICTGEYFVKHCTSAIDAVACFYQIKEFWKKLAWPDLPGSYNFVLKVVDAICSSAAYYAEITHQKLADSGYYEEHTPYKTTDEVIAQMCVAINGLEYVRRWLLTLGEELRVEQILTALENQAGESIRIQWRNALITPLEQTPEQMLLFINQIVSRIGAKMRPPLKKAMFHLAWSPDSLPTTEAIAPLVEYLDVHLVALNSALLAANFNRILQDIWEVVLSELSSQMDGNAEDKPVMFYERLHKALDLLIKFFNADDKGLPLEVLRRQSFMNAEERLQYHKMDTTFLIDRFYYQRLQDQYNTTTCEYGVLTVRAYLNHDSLCVEVINARDVIPLDPNGFSDPFVIIELLPRRMFEHCAEQQTNVKKRTLNPMFDECFEFSVNVEQCRDLNAMILFTVMDHDVLTANDFAGEAFLGLSTIPGVADTNTNIENFHGLKHQELPLMHQKNRNHPILQILETRIGDKMALDFVKKQKQRFAA